MDDSILLLLRKHLRKIDNMLGGRIRKIIHIDLDAFFCSAEELRRPELKGTPFAVGGRPDARGVVASCSYAARRFGVHSAMPMAQALRACPQMTVLPGDHAYYGELSRKVMGILGDFTALIEQISIDEAFLDLTDLPESGDTLAHRIQDLVDEKTGLPCSLGVASNKLVAKIANDQGKKCGKRKDLPPRSILVVPPGSEADFLAPLPVQALWGIGPKTAARMTEIGFYKVGDLAAAPLAELLRLFGNSGVDLHERALGIDNRPVETEFEAKSISQEITYDKDVHDQNVLFNTLQNLAEQVAYRLRKSQYCAGTVRIKLRWSDFTTITRQASLDPPTNREIPIQDGARKLFQAAWPPGKPVRLLGVGVSRLQQPVHQLELLDHSAEKEERLLEAMDELREKYGRKAVLRGRNLKARGHDS